MTTELGPVQPLTLDGTDEDRAVDWDEPFLIDSQVDVAAHDVTTYSITWTHLYSNQIAVVRPRRRPRGDPDIDPYQNKVPPPEAWVSSDFGGTSTVDLSAPPSEVHILTVPPHLNKIKSSTTETWAPHGLPTGSVDGVVQVGGDLAANLTFTGTITVSNPATNKGTHIHAPPTSRHDLAQLVRELGLTCEADADGFTWGGEADRWIITPSATDVKTVAWLLGLREGVAVAVPAGRTVCPVKPFRRVLPPGMYDSGSIATGVNLATNPGRFPVARTSCTFHGAHGLGHTVSVLAGRYPNPDHLCHALAAAMERAEGNGAKYTFEPTTGTLPDRIQSGSTAAFSLTLARVRHARLHARHQRLLHRPLRTTHRWAPEHAGGPGGGGGARGCARGPPLPGGDPGDWHDAAGHAHIPVARDVTVAGRAHDQHERRGPPGAGHTRTHHHVRDDPELPLLPEQEHADGDTGHHHLRADPAPDRRRCRAGNGRDAAGARCRHRASSVLCNRLPQ
jgi:hypothetical protein